MSAGCGGGSADKPGPTPRKPAPSGEPAAPEAGSQMEGPTVPEGTLTEKVDPTSADALSHCDLLSPTLVAEVLEVSSDSLRQALAGGCAYTVTSPDQEVSASLRRLEVADGDFDPVGRFALTTRSITKEQAAEITARMAEKAAEKAEKAGKEVPAADDLPPVPAVTFEDVEGVGDQARLNTTTGDLHVRAANVLFVVNAFKGPRAPRPAAGGADAKAAIERARKAHAKHIASTMDERRDLAVKLAKAVIAAAPEVLQRAETERAAAGGTATGTDGAGSGSGSGGTGIVQTP